MANPAAPDHEYRLSDNWFSVTPGSTIGYIDALDISCWAKKNGKGQRKEIFSFQPVHIWRAPSGKRIQLSNNLPAINALSEYVLKKERDKGYPLSEEYVLGRMMFIHGKQHPGGEMVLPGSGKTRNQYLAALKKHVMPDQYETIVNLLPEAKMSNNQGKWECTYSIITREGAIEKHTYSGNYNPLYIKKSEIEVMMPIGTVPFFEFLPAYSDDED
jgi:hypothetical protein